MSAITRPIPVSTPSHDMVTATAVLAVVLSECPMIRPRPRDWIEDVIDDLRAQIDEYLTRQLNEILRAPDFQTLESAWRGLHYLVRNSATDDLMQIKFFNVSRSELDSDLTDLAWEESRLFELLHEMPFGTLGEVPFAYVVADFAFSHAPSDVRTLRQISLIAAAAQLPFLAAVGPDLLGVHQWRDLTQASSVSAALDAPDHAEWRDLRDRIESRYLGLCGPRVLSRLAYGEVSQPVAEFRFDEDADPVEGRNLVWMNAAYAMAVNINRAQASYGWCTRFRGIQSGGALVDVPAHAVVDRDGTGVIVCPAETDLGERLEHELAKAGLIPLLHGKNTGRLAFVSAPSLFKPPRPHAPVDVEAEAARHISARFPYMFPAYRFAQYLKCMIRDTIGVFRNPADLTSHLQAWIDQYVDADILHSSEPTQMRFPLAAGSIVVENDGASPSLWRVQLLVQPNYQLEGIDVGVPLEVWRRPRE